MIGDLPSYISQLELHNFRNHQNLEIKLDGKFILILGENGSGKTNILEAISLLNASKGIRNSKNSELIINFNKQNAQWAVKVNYFNQNLDYHLLVGCKFNHTNSNGKKLIRVNDNELTKKTDISNLLKIVWLTPQMENLFLESPGIRRKFLDRMTYNFFSNHAEYLLKYEYFTQSRSKILCDIDWDNKWLEQIEMNIAELSLKIIDNRLECIKIINSFLESLTTSYLKPTITTYGEIEGQLKKENPAKVYEYILDNLRKKRNIDSKSKRCGIGSHKSDLLVSDREKCRVATLCSTGEQKSMIISMILGQSYAIYDKSKIAPILLLDEVFAHLYDRRKENLIFELEKTPSQIWISSTNIALNKMIKTTYTKFIL